MSFVAAAVGGSALLGLGGSMIQADATSDAAEKQLQAAREANELQERMFNKSYGLQEHMYNQGRSDLEPWRLAGVKSLSQLGNGDFQRDFTAADFQKDPGYDFRMQEGQKAIERSAAARGGLQSGGTLRALSRYGQDYASGEYQNAYNRFNSDRDRRFNRLSSVAGLGQTTSSQVGTMGANYANSLSGLNQGYANQVGANTMGAANAAGAAGIGAANAWGNTLSGLGRTGMEVAWMQNYKPKGTV